MADSLRSSRCAVAVLCPTFVEKHNESWFHLDNLITDIDVVYVLYGGLDMASVTQLLSPAITASIRNSRCLTWSWPIDDDAKQGLGDQLKTAMFWCHLKLAIPNRRRRTTSADVDRLLSAA